MSDFEDPLKVIEFGNCGIGDGSFLTKHNALVVGLKQFSASSYKLEISNIPGAVLGGYNYKLDVFENLEEIEQFIAQWAKPGKLVPPYHFHRIKKASQ